MSTLWRNIQDLARVGNADAFDAEKLSTLFTAAWWVLEKAVATSVQKETQRLRGPLRQKESILHLLPSLVLSPRPPTQALKEIGS